MEDKPNERNPDFDDHRAIWDDAYSGCYGPAPYSEQFAFHAILVVANWC